MENTWASGAVELLRHADSHIDLRTAFDRRIAFISIDNAMETMIRTFVSLPTSKSGIKISKVKINEAGNSFPKLLEIFWDNVGNRLTGIDQSDIEHYHRIRNTLYHNGTGLSVDEQYIFAYRQIAALILQELFGITPVPAKPAATLENLILLWNRLDHAFKARLGKSGIDTGKTFFWEQAMRSGLLDSKDITELTELRMIRNKQVHSTEIDNQQIEYAIKIAENLIKKFS